jgi:TonB-linked SusC/RagA family outer membrane protein
MKRQVLKTLGFCCFFLFCSFALMAQKKTVSGKITDQNGIPVPGATVQLKGTSAGQVADALGNYSITVNDPQSDRLIFSMLGFATVELSVSSGTVLDVKLQEDNTQLNEVVVVGYGTQRRKDLTGSVASVKGDAFKNQPITNATEALQGRIAGVNIVKNSGAPDASPTIIIRGVSSLNQPNPLYIVDGVRVTDISNINIQDIESMDVLKDAASASIYGAAAAGGVVLVTTKKGATAAPQFNYNYRYGVTTPKVGEWLDKDGYIKLQNIINPGRFTNAARLDTLANTDWIDETFNNANEQNHNLSFSGAAPIVDYLASGFYNKQEGVARKNFSNIGGGRLNTNFRIGNWLKFGEQLSVSRRSTSNPQNVGVEAQLHNAPFRTIPIIPVLNKDGSYGTAPTGYGFSFAGTHPVGAIDNASVENFKNNFQGNVYAEVKLPLDLTLRSNVGYTFYDETQNYFQNAFAIGGVGAGKNSLNKVAIESQSLLTN